ncbi:hypothetical protein KM043_009673 [Ampulex compressa]|nr:hypothetical protein KM043_009673 [Ampulex compressa]
MVSAHNYGRADKSAYGGKLLAKSTRNSVRSASGSLRDLAEIRQQDYFLKHYHFPSVITLMLERRTIFHRYRIPNLLKDQAQQEIAWPTECMETKTDDRLSTNCDSNQQVNTTDRKGRPSKKDLRLPSYETIKLMYSMEETEIERNTRGQYKSAEWVQHRRIRITSSMFGIICQFPPRFSLNDLIKRIITESACDTQAKSWGVRYEKKAIKDFEKYRNVKVQKCGLIVDKELRYLAASPDGFVNADAIVEVKCPYRFRNMSPWDALRAGRPCFLILKDNQLRFDIDHFFMYQIQGLLHITKRRYCNYVLWTPKGILVTVIERDDEFWQEKIQWKLEIFYHEILLPQILRISQRSEENCSKSCT